MASSSVISSENWQRVNVIGELCIKEAYLDVLHNRNADPSYQGLPEDGAQLFQRMDAFRKIHGKTLKNVIHQQQWNIICPPTGISNSIDWDITIIRVVIQYECGLPEPISGWKTDNHSIIDITIAANVCVAKKIRNELKHGTINEMADPVKHNNLIDQIERVLLGMNYRNMNLFNELKCCSMKVYTPTVVKIIEDRLSDIEVTMKDTANTITDVQKELKVELQDLKKKLNEHDAQLNRHDTQLNRHDTQLNQHDTQLDQQDAQLDHHDTQLNQHDTQLNRHDTQLDQHDSQFNQHDTQLNQHDTQLNQHDAQLNQHDTQINQHGVQITENQKRIESLEKENQRKIEEEEKRTPQNDPRVQVFTHFGNGCVLKFQSSSTDQIQNVKYKSIAPKQDCHWTEIPGKTEGNIETICYEEYTTEDYFVLVKIENFESIKRYCLCVETVEDHYNTNVEIYDEEKCGHVIRADKNFIVLAPPSGRLEDDNCCKDGMDGKFLEKEMTLNVPIAQGPIDGKMKVNEFTDFSNTYRNRNFPTTKDVIEFPPFSCIKDPDVKRTAKQFSKLLSTWKGLRAVVWNSNSKKYLQRVLQSKVSLQLDLSFNNRVMVYDESTSSVLNIRVLQQSGSPLKGMEHIVRDLKSFITCHKHLKPPLYCLGLLCFPNASRREVKSQMELYFSIHSKKYVELFYVCKEDLENLENLKKWWKEVFEKELERLERIYQCQRCHLQQNNNSFGDVLSECLATVAMANITTTPTLAEDTHLQIKTLLLNADQIEAIEHPSLRKLVLGNYGSGKSIVADEIFKKIYKQHRFERRKLLNVVWEKYSLLEVHKHNLLQEIESTYPGCSEEFNVSIGTLNNLNEGKDVSLLEFLTKELEGNEVVDIIIDELPSEAIHESEVKTLKKLLDDHPDSSVVFIPQSVIIDRKKNNDDGKSITIGRNCLRKIGLQEFSLSKTMRNSKQICAVLKCLQQQHMDSVLTIYEERIDQATTHRVDRKSIPQKIRTIWKSITRKKKATSSEASTSEAKKEITESRVTENAVDAQTKHLNPYFDKVAKHLHDGESKDSEKSTEVLSSYRFFETKVGNQVNDHKPILVNLPSIFDVKNIVSGKLLAITLKEVCKLSPQTLIICNILEEIKLVSFSLSLLPEYLHEIYIPYLQGYIPTVKEKRSLMDKFSVEKSIILLDNTGAKGIESRNVIIFIKKHEHFLRHEFVETLARANISCYAIMYTSPDSTQHEENTMGSIMTMLIDNGLVKPIKVTSEKDHTNFEKSHRFHGNDLIVNDVYCKDQTKTSFDTFLEKFNEKYPILSKELNYRNDLENLTKVPLINHIVHEVEHNGHTYKFRDVWRMLDDKDFGSFESIIDVNPNIINNLRYGVVDDTLLMHAIHFNHVDICEYLTSKFTEQIDYIAKNSYDGWTVFHYAARYNNINAMNILIAKDRRGLEIRGHRGQTPLFDAAYYNRKSMVILLLENGVDPHVKDHGDLTADRQRDNDGHDVVNKDIQRIIRGYQTKNASTGTS